MSCYSSESTDTWSTIQILKRMVIAFQKPKYSLKKNLVQFQIKQLRLTDDKTSRTGKRIRGSSKSKGKQMP